MQGVERHRRKSEQLPQLLERREESGVGERWAKDEKKREYKRPETPDIQIGIEKEKKKRGVSRHMESGGGEQEGGHARSWQKRETCWEGRSKKETRAQRGRSNDFRTRNKKYQHIEEKVRKC